MPPLFLPLGRLKERLSLACPTKTKYQSTNQVPSLPFGLRTPRHLLSLPTRPDVSLHCTQETARHAARLAQKSSFIRFSVRLLQLGTKPLTRRCLGTATFCVPQTSALIRRIISLQVKPFFLQSFYCGSSRTCTVNDHASQRSYTAAYYQVAMGQHHSRDKMAQAERCELIDTIEGDRFFQIDEAILLNQVQDAFPSELERLKSASVSERPKSDVQAQRPSPSMRIYGKEYDEVNRTLTGLLSLRWIWNNEYDQFTKGQREDRRLTRPSFDWLRELFRRNLHDSEDLELLVISMVINDLGKDPSLVREVVDLFERDGRHFSQNQNHDAVLYEATNLGIIDCLKSLNDQQMEELKLGLALGAELNAGQLAQAESVPINLEFLQDMKGKEHAFEMKFMEQMLDVAGAHGHVNSDGAVNLTQPVFDTFQTVHDVSVKIISHDMALREAYDQVLKRRNRLLVNVGFRRLSVGQVEDRALLRLLTMGRTVDRDQAELFAEAFEDLDDKNRRTLIEGLNINGDVNERAVLPYYMPAVLADVLQTTESCTKPERRRALTSIMRYLAKVYEQSPKADVVVTGGDSPSTPTSSSSEAVPGVVVEHNMMIVRNVIKSADFAKNPDQLDDLDIPPAQQLQRRRTSHSLASGESEYLPKPISRSGTALSAPPGPINEGMQMSFRSPFGKG